MENVYVPPDPEMKRMRDETLKMVCSFAPSSTAAKKAADLLDDLAPKLGSKNLHGQLRAAVGMLYDGLAYGNWPWIDHSEVK